MNALLIYRQQHPSLDGAAPTASALAPNPFVAKSLLLIFSLLIYLAGSSIDAYASARVALVIGNSNYKQAKLRNTLNDANDVAKTLGELGFDVILRTDVDRKSMRKAIREFGNKLDKNTVGLFYYAGHGVQVGGENYLIPVDADIEAENEVPDESISASSVLRKIDDAGNRLNVVILDACRNNPFARSFRSTSPGLARVDAPLGSIVAYSTAPGSLAADGRGRNGTYTKHLLQAIKTPGLSIEQVFKKIRNNVIDATNGKQIPWEETSLRDDFYFTKDPRSNNSVIKTASIKPSNVMAVNSTQAKKIPKRKAKQQPVHKKTSWPKLGPDAFRDKLKNGSLGPWMIQVAAGQFTMGGDYYNEKPKRKVFVEKAFSIMAYEVTAQEYARFTRDTNRQYTAERGFNPDARPIINISWHDARAYAKWISDQTGYRYRLPTEVEWEFVAKGAGKIQTASRALPDSDPNCSDCGEKWRGKKTVAVNTLSKESAGTRGMLGNVWEWVEDCWHESYDASHTNASPRISNNCSNRTLRGGSWNFLGRYSTPSARMGVSAYTKTAYVGFRLVRETKASGS